MMLPGGPGDGAPSLESLRELRLRALLNDLVNDLGPGKLSERLGVDRKTLWRWQREAQLPPRLADALERMLLERAVAALEQDRQRVRELQDKIADLERQLALALTTNGDDAPEGTAYRERHEEFAREIQRLERRLERLEAGRAQGNGPGRPGPGRTPRQRRHPDLVTREPAGDDREVYGAAHPLVEEWRNLWAIHPPQGRGLAWVSRRQRILELEVAMLEEHGLTLPPETAPLQGPDRREQLSWRQRELAKVRQRRARLELLDRVGRVLTLRQWRQ